MEKIETRGEPSTRIFYRRNRVKTLLDLLEIPANERPDDLAVELVHPGAPSERMTYGDLWKSARVTAGLLERSGVRRGDRVAIVLPTSRAFLDAFFGTILSGAVPVPVAPPLSMGRREAWRQRLESILQDSQAGICLTLPRYFEELDATRQVAGQKVRFLSPESSPSPCSPGEVHRPEPGETAFLQYTSGSTSDPKGVELTHANLVANVSSICLTVGDSLCGGVVSWLPLHHDMGLIGMLFCSLYRKKPLFLMSPQSFMKDPSLWLRTISETGATVSCAPNFAFRYCVDRLEDEDLEGINLESLKVLLNGAEPIDIRAIERFEEKFRPIGLPENIIRPVYGLAESSLAVTFSKPGAIRTDRIDSAMLEEERVALPAKPSGRERVCVSVGKPIRGQEIRIADENDESLPERRVGEILVRGDSVMKGYFGDSAKNREALRGGWLHTGDDGYLADGHLYITGRRKDMIVRRGKKYQPEDIELAITQQETDLAGSIAAFGLETDSDTSLLVIAETRCRCRETLGKLETRIKEQVARSFLFRPEVVHFVRPGAIPRTSSGKVRRQSCKKLFLEGKLARRI